MFFSNKYNITATSTTRKNSLENTLETQYNRQYVNNDNDYFIDVTNLGLHNKDFALVTQASILVIYISLR